MKTGRSVFANTQKNMRNCKFQRLLCHVHAKKQQIPCFILYGCDILKKRATNSECKPRVVTILHEEKCDFQSIPMSNAAEWFTKHWAEWAERAEGNITYVTSESVKDFHAFKYFPDKVFLNYIITTSDGVIILDGLDAKAILWSCDEEGNYRIVICDEFGRVLHSGQGSKDDFVNDDVNDICVAEVMADRARCFGTEWKNNTGRRIGNEIGMTKNETGTDIWVI